jgi:hypothetical protein
VTPRGDPYYDDYHYGGHPDEIDYAYDHRPPIDGFGRRRSCDDDDGRSYAASRYSRHSRRSHRLRSPERQLALTEGNLKTHSEVSATSPSKAYRSPYAETAPRDMQLSRPTLAIGPPPPASESAAPSRHQLVHRPRSDTALTKKKSIDMNLAYGDIPPDLASRVDLDPVDNHTSRSAPEDPQETEALTLMDRIEDYLEQAHCVHHTASSMIENLQRNPEAAAAVALSLAELSTLIGKMSPAFLGLLKGGSPAVFALLASPQFLIGAGVAVGVTVVMFGGWKIVKRLKDSATASKTLEAPLEMRALPMPAAAPTVAPERALPPVPAAGASAASYDEALVLRDVEELSTIETWRRGIVACGGDDESADVELMSRAAERALKDKYNRDFDEVEPCDSVSQVSRARSDRSRRSYRSHRSSGSQRHRDKDGETKVSERKSSAAKKDKDGEESEAASERSRRSHRSGRAHEGSAVSRSSKHSSKTTLKAIEEGDGGGDSSSAAGKPKEKKRDMIKQLFKMKKDKEDRERAVSVLV